MYLRRYLGRVRDAFAHQPIGAVFRPEVVAVKVDELCSARLRRGKAAAKGKEAVRTVALVAGGDG